MHFYESSIITTTDGLHCQVYANEHPVGKILVKPKYIPTDKIHCDALPYRFISGKRMNRLNLWIDKDKLKKYFHDFEEQYNSYVYRELPYGGDRLFFVVPVDKIERVYFPRKGLSELMSMPEDVLDPHLKNVHQFIQFLIKSGLQLRDFGVTYSTLMGHYFSDISDINVVVYGKANYWKLMAYLEHASHPLLRWKTREDWMTFYKGRNRFALFTEDEFYTQMKQKKSEGYFNNTLFVLFAAEEEGETWLTWGDENYTSMGLATVEGTVTDHLSSVVRPGCYDITDSHIVEGKTKVLVTKVVFYSRDYGMLAIKGEKIRACGLLEKVESKTKGTYHRVVIGYFDAYITERREKEYVKRVQ